MPSVLIDADVLRECREALEETAWADWGKLTHLQFNQMRMSADAALSRLPDEGPEPFERNDDGDIVFRFLDGREVVTIERSDGVCYDRDCTRMHNVIHLWMEYQGKSDSGMAFTTDDATKVAHAILALVSGAHAG